MDIDRHLINTNATLLEALGKLNALSGGQMTLVATDSKGRLKGTVTDGDLRRALLRGASLESAVAGAMNTGCCSVAEGDDHVRALRSLRSRGVKLVPVTDRQGRVADLIDLQSTPTRLPVGAILMAGGKGERLRPLTLDTPKPLLPLGGKAVIDHNIEALARAGVTDISVTVNYLAEKLEEHFATPVAGVQVKCVLEPMALGTIGAARLCTIPAQGDTIVMNSDLLTTVSFEDMYLHHISQGADITVAAVPYNVSVPYAILTTSGSRVLALEEKPTYAHYANAGIYIIANRLLRSLPEGKPTHATDLIERTLATGGQVTYYPIAGTWIDIGSPADYAHARELMRHLDTAGGGSGAGSSGAY